MDDGVGRIGTEPIQKPSRSKQDYGTPQVFIEAVEARFGSLTADLAATLANKKAAQFIAPENDSLSVPWAELWPEGNLWLNPPYGDLYTWTAKCKQESKKRHGLILALLPAGIGALWFFDNVKKHAMTLALAPRLTFEGCTAPYPKDCILSVFGYGFRGFDCWNWRHGHVATPNGPAE